MVFWLAAFFILFVGSSSCSPEKQSDSVVQLLNKHNKTAEKHHEQFKLEVKKNVLDKKLPRLRGEFVRKSAEQFGSDLKWAQVTRVGAITGVSAITLGSVGYLFYKLYAGKKRSSGARQNWAQLTDKERQAYKDQIRRIQIEELTKKVGFWDRVKDGAGRGFDLAIVAFVSTVALSVLSRGTDSAWNNFTSVFASYEKVLFKKLYMPLRDNFRYLRESLLKYFEQCERCKLLELSQEIYGLMTADLAVNFTSMIYSLEQMIALIYIIEKKNKKALYQDVAIIEDLIDQLATGLELLIKRDQAFDHKKLFEVYNQVEMVVRKFVFGFGVAHYGQAFEASL